jgi:hypothetical protein
MTSRNAARALAVVAAAGLVLAACGQAGAPTSPPGGTPAAVVTSAPATRAPGATEGPAFSFVLPSEDKALEALLPDQIGGKAVLKVSQSGESFLRGGGASSADFLAILTQFGKAPADLSVAFGGTTDIQLGAFRIKGVDPNQVFNAFLQVVKSAQGDVVTDVTLGGKPVKKVVTVAGDTSYIHASGDVLFTVNANATVAPALLDEVFSKLP